jgi:hypothetical protein
MAIAFDGYIMSLEAIQKAYDDIMSVDFNKLTSEGELSKEEIKEIKNNWMYTQENGVPSGEMIRVALTKIRNFEGASGLISFNGTNEADKSAVINHIVNGEVQVPKNEVEIQGEGADDKTETTDKFSPNDLVNKINDVFEAGKSAGGGGNMEKGYNEGVVDGK